MTAVAYTIRQGPKGLVEMQSSGNIELGTELERRLAGCLDLAVTAAMHEVFAKYQNGITITRPSIAAKAQAVCRAALEREGPDGFSRAE